MNTSPVILEAAAGQLKLRGLTVEQYDYLIEAGLIDEDVTTELLDGFIVDKDRSAVGEDPMTVGDRHRIVVIRLMDLAPKAPQLGCYLQVQQPIVLPPNYEPEPDASIIRGSISTPSAGKPRANEVCSVVEVSDNSLRRDLGTKLRVYARAQIPQYVVVNLVDNVVLDHREPAEDRYARVEMLRPGETLQLLAASGRALDVAVSHLLP